MACCGGCREADVVAYEVAPTMPGAPSRDCARRRADVDLRVARTFTKADVLGMVRNAPEGRALSYVVRRAANEYSSPSVLLIVPGVVRGLYYSLALVGILALAIGTSVRLRRPHDPATLHFFWLGVAFFGVLSFTPSGRYDRLDYFFEWADVVARLVATALLPFRARLSGAPPFMDSHDRGAQAVAGGLPARGGAGPPACVCPDQSGEGRGSAGGAGAHRAIRVRVSGGLPAWRVATDGSRADAPALGHGDASASLDRVGVVGRSRAVRHALRAAAGSAPFRHTHPIRRFCWAYSAGVRVRSGSLPADGHRGAD